MATVDPRMPERDLATDRTRATVDPRMPERDLATDRESLDDSGRGFQVVAIFETIDRARLAKDRLVEEGISGSEIEVLDRDAETGDIDRDSGGMWAKMKRLFGGHQETPGLIEGLRRGHAMVIVRPTASEHERVVQILETFNPIDYDARQEEWRKAGWTGGRDESLTEVEAKERIAEMDRPATPPLPVVPPVPGVAPRARETLPSGEERIPIVEEQVRIGKRLVDRGGVRVRSYIVERPVDQDVTLHEVHVEVERRAVNRPAAGIPDDAFRERSIEVNESGEEAVVQKDARVVEEVLIRKGESDRTEKVHGTVRKTEVEVEDSRTGKKVGPTKSI